MAMMTVHFGVFLGYKSTEGILMEIKEPIILFQGPERLLQLVLHATNVGSVLTPHMVPPSLSKVIPKC